MPLAQLELYNYRNRSYSTTLGRFLQTDPIRFDAGDVNLYRYVSNNPVNWIDPQGLRRKSAKERCECEGGKWIQNWEALNYSSPVQCANKIAGEGIGDAAAPFLIGGAINPKAAAAAGALTWTMAYVVCITGNCYYAAGK